MSGNKNSRFFCEVYSFEEGRNSTLDQAVFWAAILTTNRFAPNEV